MVFAEIHDGLTDMDENLEYRPGIARAWDIAPDRRSITFHLRPWTWSDGAPLTAYDVQRSCELFADTLVASPKRGTLREVTRATALDSATIRYEFARPQADPLASTYHLLVPLHVVSRLVPADVSSWPLNRQPVASGPFMLDSWESNRSLALVRNPHYPGPPALLERVVFKILPEANTRLVALETGEVDFVDDIDPDAAVRLAGKGRVRIVSVGGRSFYYLGWNCRRALFAEPETRRALSLAFDRQFMVETLLKGYGQPAAGPIPPVVWNHRRGLEAPQRDLVQARALLASVGWVDTDDDGVLDRGGERFSFEIITRQGDPVRENGAVMIGAQLRELGIETRLRVMEHLSGVAKVRAGTYDAYFGRMNANLAGDPSAQVSSRDAGQFNYGHYANARVDSLLGAATGPLSREESLPLWLELQEVLVADPPVAYLMYPDNLVGVSSRLRDARPHQLSPINNLAEWWIAAPDRIYRSSAGGR
jgi:peptide/nickel transport system substrate-binding protein